MPSVRTHSRFRLKKVGHFFWTRFSILDGDYEIGPFRSERDAQKYILAVFGSSSRVNGKINHGGKMGLAAYKDTTSERLSPVYTIPKMRDEEIVCDFCEEEVPIVIGLGTLWVCEACFDDAREQWTGGGTNEYNS